MWRQFFQETGSRLVFATAVSERRPVGGSETLFNQAVDRVLVADDDGRLLSSNFHFKRSIKVVDEQSHLAVLYLLPSTISEKAR